MQYVDWFVATIKDKFDMVVDSKEVSFEAYEFYHEELDELLIPEEHLKKLPDPLLFETLMYVDNEGYEWVAGVVKDKEIGILLYEVWIKNGEQLANKLYV
jgi:hypothetical protein